MGAFPHFFLSINVACSGITGDGLKGGIEPFRHTSSSHEISAVLLRDASQAREETENSATAGY